jgi:hypothetical protein
MEQIEEARLAVLAGAAHAIKFFVVGKIPDEETIMSSVIKNVHVNKDLRLFVIAGANFAIKQKNKNLKVTERIIMQTLSDKLEDFVEEIDRTNNFD